MRRTDADALTEVFEAMSPQSRYLRYHTATSRLTAAMLQRLLDLDGVLHHAVLAEARDGNRWRPVGIARFDRTSVTDAEAEAAVEVVDEWHGRGIGLLLVRELFAEAGKLGVHRLIGMVLPHNKQVVTMVRHHFPQPTLSLEDGVLRMAVPAGDTRPLCADASPRRGWTPD
jgi:L-amino acid N-acyltransferase YncA